jgi:DNA-binding MarR family transcriptional regulator
MSRPSAARLKLLTDLDREFRQASGLGVVFSQAVADRLGITGSDLECLDFIVLRGGVASAGELAEATGLTTGAVTGMIDRLEKAGVAKRDRDPNDRRKVLVRLMPAAEKRISPIYIPLQQAMQDLLSQYSDEQLTFLHEFMSKSGRIMADEIARQRTKPPAKKN